MDQILWWILGILALAALAFFLFRARQPEPRAPGLPGGVTLRYTNHARERMSQRGVTTQQVAAALARPDRQEQDPVENSMRIERDFDGRTLKVWLAEPWPPTREAVVKSTAWHYHDTIRIPADQIGKLIGRRGGTIEELRRTTGARVSVEDDGTVQISGDDHAIVQAAKRAVRKIVG